MSAPITGILSQHAAAQNLQRTLPVHSQATASTAGAASDSSTISANDFLTLLVTEMKNQDPTANTNPNEYINQLVQVNSLEQLISINQTLTSGSSASGSIAREPAVQEAAMASDGVPHAAAAVSTLTPVVEGNLTVPPSHPAAIRVANSLAVPPPVR